jgi:hypothetical protein
VRRVFHLGVVPSAMGDTDNLDSAVEAFLSEADSAYEEYDRGYTDADATLRRLESAIERLRTASREE